MSLKVCVLGSGSTGNCIFVSSANSVLLVDLGLPATRVEKCMGVLGADPDKASVLVTHCHSDHISGLGTFCRRHPDVKVYCHSSCRYSIGAKAGAVWGKLVPEDSDFFVGDVTVSPFVVSHDVPCVGYGLLSGGKKVSIVTDAGTLNRGTLDMLSDSDVVIMECNHDEKMLQGNAAYPPQLKRRILSESGHLSNSSCAEYVAYLAGRGVRQFVLAHLSRENNYPELAFRTCSEKLSACGLTEGVDVKLEVAGADRMSSLFEIS